VDERIRFLRALVLLSAVIDDELTRLVAGMLERLQAGEHVDAAAELEPRRGALLPRVRIAVEAPTLARLRALWVLCRYDERGVLQGELEVLVRAWSCAAKPAALALVASELVAWFEVRRGRIALALRGPFARA
jgi:hypothetical protein